MNIAVDVSDDLLMRARALAQRESITFDELVEQGLRLILTQYSAPAAGNVKIEPFVVAGQRPGPDLSWDHLREILYGSDR